MDRRTFLRTAVASLLAAPLVCGAQQLRAVPRIGYLTGAYSCIGPVSSREAFWQGLNALGYFEGRNIAIECRSAEGKFDRLSDLAAELVRLKVDVIVAAGGETVARAAAQESDDPHCND
jgi:putative ABC transport system substrate-binding protein